jgi:hypothetical protein
VQIRLRQAAPRRDGSLAGIRIRSTSVGGGPTSAAEKERRVAEVVVVQASVKEAAALAAVSALVGTIRVVRHRHFASSMSTPWLGSARELRICARPAHRANRSRERFTPSGTRLRKVRYRELSQPEAVQAFEAWNLEKYGDALGPSIEQTARLGKELGRHHRECLPFGRV